MTNKSDKLPRAKRVVRQVRVSRKIRTFYHGTIRETITQIIVAVEEQFSLDDYKLRIELDGPRVTALNLEIDRQRRREEARIAENALREPTRVLYFNMGMIAFLLVLGAAVLQYVSVVQFILLTGFILSAIVVVNAFHLRSIDKLSDKSFLELMKLALLKFFAPLTRRR